MATKIERLEVGGGYGNEGATIDENGNIQSDGSVNALNGIEFGATVIGNIICPEGTSIIQIQNASGEGKIDIDPSNGQITSKGYLRSAYNESGGNQGISASMSNENWASTTNYAGNFSTGPAPMASMTSSCTETDQYAQSVIAYSETGLANSTPAIQGRSYAGNNDLFIAQNATPNGAGGFTLDDTAPYVQATTDVNGPAITAKSANGEVKSYVNAEDGAVVKSTSPDGTKSIMMQATNDGAALVGVDGMIFTSAVATTDPGVAGMVWCDAANGFVLKVSQGAE